MNYLEGNAPANPLVRVVAAIGAALLLASSLFVGAFVFLIVLGIVAVMALVFTIRFWRFRRQIRAAMEQARAQAEAMQRAAREGRTADPFNGQGPFQPPPRDQGNVIDGEYRRED